MRREVNSWIYDPKAECMSDDERAKVQSERLIKCVNRMWEHVPYYRKRMEEKGAVTYVQEGRTKYFSPAIDKAEAENEEVSTLLDKVYNGNAGLLISNLVGSDRLTEEQIEELRRMFTED